MHKSYRYLNIKSFSL